MINKQNVTTTLFTKYSIVNPMSHITTANESRLNPKLLNRNAVGQHTVPVTTEVLPVPEECHRVLPPDRNATVQLPYVAVRPTYDPTGPHVAGHVRFPTENSGAGYARITTQNSPGAQTQHAPQTGTRIRTRNIQFIELGTPDSDSTTPVGGITSPHKVAQGKRRKLMEPAPWMRFHPFVATLEHWASGVSASCGDPWSATAIQAAVNRGPHTSALTPEARILIEDEMQYQIQAGFSEMITWDSMHESHPVNLKVSPLAVIPQVGRRGRLLLDLSFAVHAARPVSKRGRRNWVQPPPLAPSVNSTTIQASPDYPVKELGRVLPRLLDFMNSVPPEETIMFAKIDLSDGFWRMLVQESDKWNFAYTLLPGAPREPIRLIIPHALQMGWTESPGYFCAATETGRDIIQALIDGGTQLPPHVFDVFMQPEGSVRRQSSPAADRTWQMSAVYVDDYILAAVESPDGSALQRTGRAALHTIHGLFPPPDRSGHLGGKDPISVKKLEAGDARWSQSKELLGFVFDGRSRTVHLTQRKAVGIADAITRLLRKTRAAVPKFQSVVGKMRHVATILPSARSLFTPINRALRGHPSTISLSASGEVRAALLDLRQMVTTLAARPTHVKEILPAPSPDYIGYCDASAFGAGGGVVQWTVPPARNSLATAVAAGHHSGRCF